MKLTIWQSKAPATVDDMKSDFTRRLGAFRMATGRPERFVMRCACAIHDKGFTVTFERTDPARPFSVTGIHKDGEGEAPAGTDAARSRTLPATEVDHTGWRCPYCGSDYHIACNPCHTTVCGGKTRHYPGSRDIFTCRASCGAHGTLIDALTIEGSEPSRRPPASKPSASRPISERLPAPGADVLRLGATKGPRLK